MKTSAPLEDYLNIELIIDRQQQLEKSRRDIKTGVGGSLFIAGVILIIAILTFSSLIYPPNISHDRLVRLFGESVATYLVPFIPYLFYSLSKGISGKISLDKLSHIQTGVLNDDNLEDCGEIICQLQRIQSQINRAERKIEMAVRAGLLMGGISFVLTITFYGRPEFAHAQLDMSGLVVLLDAIVFFGCTIGISNNNPSAATIITVYSILSALMKIPPSIFDRPPSTRFDIFFPIALALSGYFLYNFCQGISGISMIDRLKETRSELYKSLKSDRDRLDENYSPCISNLTSSKQTETLLEIEHQQEIKQATQDIKEAIRAGLSIGVLNIFYFMYMLMTYHSLRISIDTLVILESINFIITFGGTYGIYRNNLLAAKIIFAYTCINTLRQGFNIPNLLIMPILIFQLYRGTIAISKLKKLTKI
jgi:hypothetical protein